MSNNIFYTYNQLDNDSLLLPKFKSDNKPKQLLNRLERRNNAIHPTPGCCLKLKTNTGEKVFINVCLSPKIKKETLLSEEPSSKIGVYLPMCFSKIRLETDKCGNLCPTFDVIMNDEYFHDIKNDKEMIMLILYSIAKQLPEDFGLILDYSKCHVLKNRKVMGTLQTQYIIDPEVQEIEASSSITKPLIQEISSSSKTVYNNINTSAQLQNKNKESTTCNYVILKEPLNGITNNLIGLFQIPVGISSKDLIVLVSADSIVITNNENKLLYNLCVPYTLNTDKTESFFDKDLMILRLNMPLHKK